jgi:signal transduction protein with GAF and PtsI domain
MALLAGLRRFNPEPGIIDRVLGDTSERDRRRLALLGGALGEQRLSRKQADAVLKLLPDALCNDEARVLVCYSALLREEMLERELKQAQRGSQWVSGSVSG